MYRELEAADHQRMLGLEPAELPDIALLVGMFDVSESERFAGYLESQRREERRFPHGWYGEYRGLRVSVTGVFGGPMAALVAHVYCGAGVPVVAQLGWYGALQRGSKVGDVLVPRHAEREDGVSDWYLAKGILADASGELVDGVTTQLTARGIDANTHAIYSTPALLAESREVIADWSRHGWQGVDMETAATFAVARSLGARRVAALVRIDDLIAEDHSLAEAVPKESRAILRAREREVMLAVLDAVVAERETAVEHP
ncbi:MAG: hypothetical protein WEC33_01790 [Dehalococcoidia bacterium]